MRNGKRPDGANYFPAFPYPSFTKIADSDLQATCGPICAPAAERPRQSAARSALSVRLALRWGSWKWLFFTPGPFEPDPSRGPTLNRGAYLVEALGHCGECHTPRNFLGGSRSRYLAGGPRCRTDKARSNRTPVDLKKWSDKDLADFLTAGQTPDGDVVAEAMGEVIRNTTSKLAPQDLDALIAYLRSLPPSPTRRNSVQ